MIVCRLCRKELLGTSQVRIFPAPAGAQCFLDTPNENNDDKISLIIAQCDFCGLVQSVSNIVPYYKSVITAAGLSSSIITYRTEQITSFTSEYNLQGKKAIEIGCGDGYFLTIIEKSGMVTFGAEYKLNMLSTANYSIYNIYPSSSVKIPNGPYDVFFCFNFLEHAPDPRDFLIGIRENLKDESFGLIEVPNYLQQKRLGRVFDYISDHVSYFDPESLFTCLTLSGFTVDRIIETRNGENLEARVRKRNANNIRNELYTIEETYKNLSDWILRMKKKIKSVAVWGASHQALTLLSRLNSSDIICIFDSAPFKQGKYAPVSHIPIIKPTVLSIKDIDCILIIASGYENEIKTILRNDLAFQGEIYTVDSLKFCLL